MTHETKYGMQPFERVTRGEFALTGLESLKQATYLQYKLMLLKPVLRASVNFAKKAAFVEYVEPVKAEREITSALRPVKAVLKSKAEEVYDDIVKSGYHG
jgi:hypothetical protein